MQNLRNVLLWTVIVLTLFAAPSQSASAQLAGAKPVPRMQVEPLPYDRASVRRDGIEIAKYHFGSALERPFIYPVIGPSGRSLTRMGHPHDANGHSHHNSVWISHYKVGGVDFWGDRSGARIAHRRVMQYEDADNRATIEMANDWASADGKVLLHEQRRMSFIPRSAKQWLLVIDLRLSAASDPVVLDKTPFGPLGVRLAKTIGVHDGGGTIRNSEGDVDEKNVFWKPARWVDYSGPIAPGINEGITLMDHPMNASHPSQFHVRNDGWMGAAISFTGPRTIGPNKPLTLRYGLYIHSGVLSVAAIDAVYQQFATAKLPALLDKPR